MNIPAALKTDAALAALAVVGIVLVSRNMQGIAASAVNAAAGVIVEAGTGAVLGVGDIVGLPRTSSSECDAALREGRSWDASFACPAGVYLNYVMNGYIDTKNKGLL